MFHYQRPLPLTETFDNFQKGIPCTLLFQYDVLFCFLITDNRKKNSWRLQTRLSRLHGMNLYTSNIHWWDIYAFLQQCTHFVVGEKKIPFSSGPQIPSLMDTSRNTIQMDHFMELCFRKWQSQTFPVPLELFKPQVHPPPDMSPLCVSPHPSLFSLPLLFTFWNRVLALNLCSELLSLSALAGPDYFEVTWDNFPYQSHW